MILDEYVEVGISSRNKQYFEDLGYEIPKHKTKRGDIATPKGTIIKVKVDDLPDGSHQRIKCKCDVCGNELYTEYRMYKRSSNNCGYYACSPPCAKQKNINTNLKKYGCENVFQNESIKEKSRQTCLEKYGTEYYTQTDEFNDRVKETSLRKYGVESPSQADEVKNKAKQTNLERYGVEWTPQRKDIQEKIKNTNLERYGCENVFANEDIKKKLRNTCIEKYGGLGLSNQEIKEKVKNTCLEKYGTEWASQSDVFRSKCAETSYKNNTSKSSKQQQELFEQIKNLYPNFFVDINYPLATRNSDVGMICDNGVKIDIEYDCKYWHMDREFEDIYRDNKCFEYGVKVLRIKSRYSLPTPEILKIHLDELIFGNTNYSEITLNDYYDLKGER